MSSLTFNPKTEDYVFIASTEEDENKAKATGLTLSTKATGQNGEPIFFTKTNYAALPFWDVADARARAMLEKLYQDYHASWAVESERDFPCPRDRAFKNYQRAGIAFGIDHGNILIGDEPGLGKTAQAIGIANAVGASRILVVCPASIRLNWQREIRAWSTIPKVRTYPILKSGHGIAPDAHYAIVSYDLLRNEGLHEAIYDLKYDLLVLDEAHYLKTIDAGRTRSLFGGGRGPMSKKPIASRAERIVALTGTPLPNRPRECYTLARALNWEAIDWMSFEQFSHRFNPQGVMDSGAVIEKKGRLPELQARLRSNFMIRRLKAEVLSELPDKSYELTYVEPNGAIREVLAKEKLIHFSVKDLKDPFAEIWGQISTIRREMGEAMVPRIIEHMKMLLDIMELPKVILFSHHRSVMDMVNAGLEKYGVVQVRGGMSALAKDASVQEFIHGKPRIFHGQLDSAGFGIDGLQNVCSRVVVGEPAWTPGTNEQAIDRAHRIGQHSNVVAQFLVVEGSLTERVLGVVLDKSHTIYESLDKMVA